jgi:hypothetical protein
MSKSKKKDRAAKPGSAKTSWLWPVVLVATSAAFYLADHDTAGTAFVTAAAAVLARRA